MANTLSFLRSARAIISYGDVEAFEVTDLRMRFEVTKLKAANNNTMKLTIYNLDPRLHAINANAKLVNREWLYGSIKLFAGYEGESGLLFTGAIKNVNTRREGVDILTDIYALDGAKATENAHMVRTFQANASLVEQLNAGYDAFSKVDLSLIKSQYIVNSVAKQKNLGSRSVFTTAKQFFDEIALEYGFDWSIQNNTLRVVGYGDTTNPKTAHVISKTTGMIDSPAVTEKGVAVKSQLIWDIAPYDAFRIESEYGTIKLGVNLYHNQTYKTLAEGQYRVLSVKHIGDTRENTWFSNIEGQRPEHSEV